MYKAHTFDNNSTAWGPRKVLYMNSQYSQRYYANELSVSLILANCKGEKKVMRVRSIKDVDTEGVAVDLR